MIMYIVIGVVVVLAVSLLWRLYSNRQAVPCPTWLSWLVELENPFAKALRAQTIIDSLPLADTMAVLDVGCGPGRVLVPLAQHIAARGGHVTGLDLQPGMLEKAQQKAAGLGLTNVAFMQGAIGTVQLPAAQYDVVLLVCVLGEIPVAARETAVRAIAAAVKPGGLVSVTETIFDPHFQRRQTVIELLQKAGFRQRTSLGNWLAYTMHFTKQ
jgi:ubiquinone/menaquinone biosynthesis C-methylase UbiE